MKRDKREEIKEEIIAKIRQRISEEVSRIMEVAVAELKNDEMDFGSIEKKIRDEVLRIGGQILEGSIQINGTGYRGSRIPCECGGKKKFVGNRKKKRQR